MDISSDKEDIKNAEEEIMKKQKELERQKEKRNQKTTQELKGIHLSSEKIFRKRSGTTDQGKPYENMIAANIILQMVRSDKIKDFYISLNDENFGDFDDVVIESQTGRRIETKAMQLKHSNRKELCIQKLASKTGDFSILKNFNCFQQIKDKAQQFILFTNLKFNISDGTKFLIQGKNFYLKVFKVVIKGDSNLKISKDIDYCYKFEILEDEWTKHNIIEVEQFKTFLEHFYLYTDQESLETLKKATVNEFTKVFSSNEETFYQYHKVISDWDMKKKTKEKLNKTMMQRVIALRLLSRQIEPFTFGSVNDRMKILREAIYLFNVTLVEESDGGVVKQLWGDFRKENFDVKKINRVRENYGLSSNYIEKVEDLDATMLTQLLWLMDKCPLILREHKNVKKAVQLCPDRKFVLLCNKKSREWTKHNSVFQSLFDLQSNQPKLYAKVMQTFTISLQGKEEVSLMTAFGENEECSKHVTTNNLLKMLNGPRYINGGKEDLPTPYIERYLSPNIISTKYLEHVKNNTVIILNCADNFEEVNKLVKYRLTDIDDLLNYSNSTTPEAAIFMISKNKYEEYDFQKMASKISDSKTVHYFKFLDEDRLEWVRSKGDVSELQTYKLSDNFKIENEFWSFQFSNSINLITADPGMGKTELTKSLKNNCPCNYWTVIFSPQDVNSFLSSAETGKTVHYIKLLETFILDQKYRCLKKLDKKFFKMCLQQNRVIYVWDAVDETLTKHLDTVSSLILTLSKKGFIQWVTSRQHLRSSLENKFNTLSLTLNQFTEPEQEDYIKQRLASIISSEDMDKTIEKIKFTFALIEHIDILGIPLQIFLLTEIIRQNNKKYLELLNNSIVLTDLYYYFIEEKFYIFYQNKLGFGTHVPYVNRLLDKEKEAILTCYERLAHRAVFSDDEIIKELKNDFQKDIEYISEDYVSFGLMTGLPNNIPQFLHASFGEYLVAGYFSKNLRLVPRGIFFNQKYNNIRFFFDMLVGKDSPAHIAVLYRNFDVLKNYDDEILARKDDCGRNALHLICSWGQRRSRLEVKCSDKKKSASYFIKTLYRKSSFSKMIPSNKKYILEVDERFIEDLEMAAYLEAVLYLCNKCKISEQDTLFKMTPLQFAQVSQSLGVELKLLQSGNLRLEDSYSHCDRINILYYSALHGYDGPIKLFMSKNWNTRLEEVNFVTSGHSRTALIIASGMGFRTVVEHLLKSGAEINRADNDGWTPLYAASENGHEKTVECLVKSGAEINRADKYGWTPLCAASFNGHENTVEYLLKSGAEVNRASNNGWTPLYAASRNGHAKTVEYLVKFGADINRSDHYGWTPLYAASFNGHEDTVEYLMKCGGKINSASNYCQTPHYAASENSHEKLKSTAQLKMVKHQF